MRVAGTRPSDQRVVIFGAGTAGVGIADQIRAVMINDGLSEADATGGSGASISRACSWTT